LFHIGQWASPLTNMEHKVANPSLLFDQSIYSLLAIRHTVWPKRYRVQGKAYTLLVGRCSGLIKSQHKSGKGLVRGSGKKPLLGQIVQVLTQNKVLF
jgi:hypothetical protein